MTTDSHQSSRNSYLTWICKYRCHTCTVSYTVMGLPSYRMDFLVHKCCCLHNRRCLDQQRIQVVDKHCTLHYSSALPAWRSSTQWCMRHPCKQGLPHNRMMIRMLFPPHTQCRNMACKTTSPDPCCGYHISTMCHNPNRLDIRAFHRILLVLSCDTCCLAWSMYVFAQSLHEYLTCSSGFYDKSYHPKQSRYNSCHFLHASRDELFGGTCDINCCVLSCETHNGNTNA